MSAILNVLSGTKNDIRDKKRYQGQKNDIRDKKRYQGDISFLCPPVINLIKAQVCDKVRYQFSTKIQMFSFITLLAYKYDLVASCKMIYIYVIYRPRGPDREILARGHENGSRP